MIDYKKSTFIKSYFSLLLLAGVILSCAKKTNSEAKVVNGRTATRDEFPSVVLLLDAALGKICTGTFISLTRVLTAAHCTESGPLSNLEEVRTRLHIVDMRYPGPVFTNPIIASSVRIFRNQEWDKNGMGVNRFDLAIVDFPRGTAKGVSSLATTPSQSGDAIEIVGFGIDQVADPEEGGFGGVKRLGYNKVARLKDGFIEVTGARKTSDSSGTNALSAPGDSGGPIFVRGKLAAVVSGGKLEWFRSARSFFVDVTSPESQAFLKRHPE